MPPKCPDSVAPGGNIQKTGASGYYECVSQDPEHGGYTLCAANTSKDEARFDYQLEDQRIRDSALGHLELAFARLSSSDNEAEGKKGFFIGCGFHKVSVYALKHGPSNWLFTVIYVPRAHLTMNVTSVLAQPHVPFVFPAEFLDYFPEDLADIPLADDTYAPIGMPDAAWHFPAVRGTPRYKKQFLLGVRSSSPHFLDEVLTL